MIDTESTVPSSPVAPSPDSAEMAALRTQLADALAENAALQASNRDMKVELEAASSERRRLAADELIVAEKMRFGMSRAQALNVIERQKRFDREHPTKTVVYHSKLNGESAAAPV